MLCIVERFMIESVRFVVKSLHGRNLDSEWNEGYGTTLGESFFEYINGFSNNDLRKADEELSRKLQKRLFFELCTT